MDEKGETCPRLTPFLQRRTVLKTALGIGMGLGLVDLAAAQEDDPREAPPQADDQFVFAPGDREGETIAPDDLILGGPQVVAYPMDPRTGVVRDGSRLNRVLLIRLNPEELGEAMGAQAAAGIVAYSAVCTHTGCDVSDWLDETMNLLCPCHDSEFDPRDGARVLSGPARRRLAVLPLKLADGVLKAAGGFSGRVGFKKK